jgi:hypothetical protein
MPRLLKILSRLSNILFTEATPLLVWFLSAEPEELLVDLVVLVLRLSEHFLAFGALDMGTLLAVVEAMLFELRGLDQVMAELTVNDHLAFVLHVVFDYCWLFE